MTFLEAMLGDGYEPDEFIFDGRFHRFRTADDKPRQKSGWYVCHGEWGSYGDWKTGFKRGWRESGRQPPVDGRRHPPPNETEKHERARIKACNIWARAPWVIHHPYLTAKGVKPHGVRQWKDAVVVPARSGGQLSTLQFIKPDGSKLFMRGGKKRGSYHLIGQVDQAIFIAEGYATAASLYESTDVATAVAFDCGNLLPAGQAIKAEFPDVQIIFAGDNDQSRGNPGVTHAIAAASDLGASYVFPETWADFNDVYVTGGAEAVRREIAAASWGLAAIIKRASK